MSETPTWRSSLGLLLLGLLLTTIASGCGGSTATVTQVIRRDSGVGASGASASDDGGSVPVVTEAQSQQLAPGYGGAQLRVCVSDKTSLVGVLDAYFTLNGSYPVPTGTYGWSSLVDQGFLKKPSETYRYELANGQPSLTGLGSCG